MRQELESVDFYIAQGYSDIAVDTLEMLERQFGPHPDIQARREKLAGRDQQPEAPAVFEFGGTEELTATPVTETITFADDSAYEALVGDGGNNVGTAKPVAPAIDAGLAELFEEFRAAEEGDEVREDYETHYNMGTAYKEMDLMDEAIQEFQTSVRSGEAERWDVAIPSVLQHAWALLHSEGNAGSGGALVQEGIAGARAQ